MVCQQLSKPGTCKVGAIAHPSFLKESDVSGVDGESSQTPPSQKEIPEIGIQKVLK
jgi:hypothetical protein